MKYLRSCNPQTYKKVINHTQLTLLQMFITWQQLVSNPSIGQHQATGQEHERIQKLSNIM
jgi:hypothetical protein